MEDKFACVHCGHVFADPDMECCPKCGTPLGYEWKPEELFDIVIEQLNGKDIKSLLLLLAEVSGCPTNRIGACLRRLPLLAIHGATPTEKEYYLQQLKNLDVAATAEPCTASPSGRLTLKELIEEAVKEEERKKAEEAARKKAEAEARKKAEEEEKRRKAEEAARKKAEEEARKKAEEEEKRRKAEEAARKKAEEEARRKEEEEKRRKAEEAARRKAEEARKKAEEEARRKAEEAARRKAEEAARRKAEAAARRKAEEEARRKAEEEARRKAEEEARRKAEEAARRKAEEEARRKAEEEARIARELEIARTTVVCVTCGTRYDKTMHFCPHCAEINELFCPTTYVCEQCGTVADSTIKVCQACGGSIVMENSGWLQHTMEAQKSIQYPPKKVCDIEIKPDYASVVQLREYVRQHMGYFFQTVEVGKGLVFSGKNAIITPASEAEIQQGNPRRIKITEDGKELTLYFKINADAQGNPVNLSLFISPYREDVSFGSKIGSVLLVPICFVFLWLFIWLKPCLGLSLKAAVLGSMDFSQIRNSTTGKLPLKSLVTYKILAIYLGFLGVHNFYAGKKWNGWVQLLLTIPLGIFLIPAAFSWLLAVWDGASNNTTMETID